MQARWSTEGLKIDAEGKEGHLNETTVNKNVTSKGYTDIAVVLDIAISGINRLCFTVVHAQIMIFLVLGCNITPIPDDCTGDRVKDKIIR